MAKGLGNNYRLWLETTTPGTYAQILGGQNLAISRSGAVIDTSTKDDYPYGSQAPGLKQVQIQCEFIPNLPDATGYTRLETLINATTPAPFNVQIRKGGAAGAGTDVVFQGSMYGTSLNHSLNQNDSAKVSVTLVSASAPTTDVMAI